MKKILCPTDFSKTATRVMEYAAYLAGLTGARLTLLHTFHLPLYETSDAALAAPEALNETSKEATDKLHAACRYLTETAGRNLQCDFQVKNAILADAVRNMVAEEKYDLVVLGSTGGGNTLEEIMIGSNTQAVIENSKCPVLAIPTHAKLPDIKTITYASDLQDADSVALQRVLDFAGLMNAEVEVVHIDKKEDTEDQRNVAAFRQKLHSTFAGKPIKFTEVNHTDEEEGLKGYLTQSNSDLLVMLKKHRSFFSKLFSNSLAETMTYHSKYPMLVLHEDHL